MQKTATVAATLLALALVGLLVLFTGAYNVAATAEHWAVTHWALNTLQTSSVGARSDEVEGAPPTDSGAVRHGLEHYDAMCVNCHGAPGAERGEYGKGMNPTPPDLANEGPEWSDQELFWITKHGIRMAGMPAFGPTHTDDEIWGIVAFLREMQAMTPEDYAARVAALQASPADSADDGHSHDGTSGGHQH